MNRAEEQVNRVLAGLRQTQPPNGLEQRIHRAVRERSLQSQQRSRGWWSTGRGVLPLQSIRVPASVTVLAGMLLMALLFAKANHHPRPGGEGLNRASPQSAVIPDALPPSRPVQAPAIVPRPRRIQEAHRRGMAPAPEILAMEEMKAPSLLAPPLPMTAQERALSRLGQRHRADVAAVLNAEHRAREQAQATTEFYGFFEPAKKPQSNN